MTPEEYWDRNYGYISRPGLKEVFIEGWNAALKTVKEPAHSGDAKLPTCWDDCDNFVEKRTCEISKHLCPVYPVDNFTKR